MCIDIGRLLFKQYNTYEYSCYVFYYIKLIHVLDTQAKKLDGW